MGDPNARACLPPRNGRRLLYGAVEPGVNLSRPAWKNASQLEPYIGRVGPSRRVRLIVVLVVTTPHAETSAFGRAACVTQDANDPGLAVYTVNSKGVEQPLRGLKGRRRRVSAHG